MAHIVLGELIERLVMASQRMSAKNPNKVTLLQAAEVLTQIGHRVAELEVEKAQRDARPQIVLAN